MNHPNKTLVILILALACVLAACAPSSGATSAASMEAGAAPAEAITATPLPPTATPTIVPTATPTPVFSMSAPINAANASGIQQLARLGSGAQNTQGWSPDSRFAAVGTGAGIFVVNAADGTLLFSDFPGNVQALSFSADSQRLAVAADMQVIEYDLLSGERLSALELDFTTHDLAYRSPTFELVVSGKQMDVFGNTTAQVIARVADGSLVEQRNLDLQVTSVDLDVARDGSALMNYTYERNRFEFFNVSGQRIGSLPLESPPGMSRTFNASLFAICNYADDYSAGPVTIYRTGGQLFATLTIDTDVILGMEISTDGSTLTAVLNRTIQQYSLPQGTLLATVEYGGYGFPSPDLTRTFDGKQVVDVTSGQTFGEVIDLNLSRPQAVTISDDHLRLVVAYQGDEPRSDTYGLWADVIDTRSLQRERSFMLRSGSFTSSDIGLFSLLADGETLALYLEEDEEVVFWNVVEGKKESEFTLDFLPSAVGVSADGAYVLAGDNQGNVALWERSTGNALVDLSGVDQWIGPYDAVFSPDGTTAAMSGSDILMLWELPGGGKRELESNGRIAISPDGRWLAQHMGNNQNFALYDLPARSLEVEWPFIGFAEELAFTSDGEVLMVKGVNRLDFLQPLDGVLLHTMNYSILDMNLSADGFLLATISYDGTTRLWGIPWGMR